MDTLRKIQPDELKEILRLHEMWVYHKEGGRPADLRAADLTGVNLSRARLRSVNLRNADLSRADLHGAYLYRADLSDADLTGANLRGAYLAEANLHDAKLTATDLHAADLTDAQLRGADLRRADLSNADMTGVNLTHATLPPTIQFDREQQQWIHVPEAAASTPDVVVTSKGSSSDFAGCFQSAHEELLALLGGKYGDKAVLETKDRLRALRDFAIAGSLYAAADGVEGKYNELDHSGVRSRIRTLAKALFIPLIDSTKSPGCRRKIILTSEGTALVEWIKKNSKAIT